MEKTFFKAFRDEMSKLAQEFEPNDPIEVPPEQPFPNDSDERSKAEQIVEEGHADSPVNDAVAGFAAVDTRDMFGKMLTSTEGRHQIRQAFDFYRDRINEVVRHRKAFTRGLLRSRREKFGPSATPRRDLRDMIFNKEPLFEANFAK